jgi:hypothetical protein
MFQSALEKTQSVLSKYFLLGSFFPVLIFNAANACLVLVAFPDTLPFVHKNLSKENVTYCIAIVVVVTLVMAYALSPLVIVFRSALDGDLLPAFIKQILGGINEKRNDDLSRELNEANRHYSQCSESKEKWMRRFQDARRTGNMQVQNFDDKAIETASQAFKALLKKQKWKADFNSPDFDAAATALEKALSRNALSPNARALANEKKNEVLATLHNLHGDFNKELSSASSALLQVFELLIRRQRATFVRGRPRVTRLGNIRAAAENYSASVYDVDFDFIWPRLQLALAKDEKFSNVVNLAEAQLNFSVSTLVLGVLIPAIWIPILVIFSSASLAFLFVAICSPLVVMFLYYLVDISQRAFGEVVRTAIDGFRLETLRMLHQRVPTRLSSERAIWRTIQAAMNSNGNVDVAFSLEKVEKSERS